MYLDTPMHLPRISAAACLAVCMIRRAKVQLFGCRSSSLAPEIAKNDVKWVAESERNRSRLTIKHSTAKASCNLSAPDDRGKRTPFKQGVATQRKQPSQKKMAPPFCACTVYRKNCRHLPCYVSSTYHCFCAERAAFFSQLTTMHHCCNRQSSAATRRAHTAPIERTMHNAARPRPRRGVTFSQYSELAYIPQESTEQKWFSSEDKQRFRQELLRDARRMSREIENATAEATIARERLYECIGKSNVYCHEI